MSRLFALAVLLAAPALAAPPNVVFFVTDDQRADAVGAFGGAVETPTMDALVGRGFAFRDAFCMGSTHGAVCQPSRAMFLTGRSLYRVPLDLKGVVTLPERFRKAGYDTFGTGKWHNGQPSFVRSFSHGGAAFFGGMHDPFAIPVWNYDATAAKPLDRAPPSKTHAETLFADAAVRFLEDEPHDKPFFVYVSFTSPHDPRTAPPEFAAKYDPAKTDLPPNFLPEHPFDNGEMDVRDEKLAARPRTPEEVRRHLADYHAMIEHVDHEIGRVLAAVEAAGKTEETLVVFMSDHGLAIGSHGLMGKQNLYDHSMRAPLVFAGPGVPHGQSDALCYLFDIFPTVCDLAGLDLPAGVEGKSLVPVMKGETDAVRDELFLSYRDVQRAIRDERWKLIVYPKAGRVQLFDLRADPDERRDLSGEPGMRPTVEGLFGRLTAAQTKLDDGLTLTLPAAR